MPRESVPCLMMLLSGVNRRLATVIRLTGLTLIAWSVFTSKHQPAGSGRGLVVTICLAVCVACLLVWTIRPDDDGDRVTPGTYALAAAGGVLLGAAPDSAASALVFVAVIIAAIRVELARALLVLAVGVLSLALAVLIYNGSGLGLLAYTLGFAAALLAASNRRQTLLRADQAELLLAQAQRSHEEQVRATRLEESTRIAREIHDVLAHTLAGLTIQLEATASLLAQGADRGRILERVEQAHTLAAEGLAETRRAVGALRGSSVSLPAGLEALLAGYRASSDAPAELTIDGDPERLAGPTAEAVLRVVQEALTNVRKHAPGAQVSIAVHAGHDPGQEVLLQVENWLPATGPAPVPDGLATSGGGYGLQGMRERAQILGGTLDARATPTGWRVELRLPSPEAVAIPVEDAR